MRRLAVLLDMVFFRGIYKYFKSVSLLLVSRKSLQGSLPPVFGAHSRRDASKNAQSGAASSEGADEDESREGRSKIQNPEIDEYGNEKTHQMDDSS
jgi:hypothetical protein